VLEIKIVERINGQWNTLPTPETLSGLIAWAKENFGKNVIMELQTEKEKRYFCGTSQLLADMKKKFPMAMIVDLENGTNLLEYAPDLFAHVLQVFTSEDEAKMAFPDPPPNAVNIKKWW
jgi:hypothetical protein